MIPAPIERWCETAKARDPARLEGLLADDVVFLSPVVHKPQRGQAIATRYTPRAGSTASR